MKHTLFISLCLGLMLANSWGAQIQEASPRTQRAPQALFQSLERAKAPLPSDTEGMLRYRSVQVRFAVLDALRVGDRIELNFFKDASYIVVIERIERHDERRTSYFGHLEGVEPPYSHVILTRVGTILLVTAYAPIIDIWYGLTYHREGYHIAYQVDPTRRGGCATNETPESPQGNVSPTETVAPDPPPDANFTPAGDFNPAACVWVARVDVMVVYTPAIRTVRGGHEAVVAAAQLGVDVSNLIYQNSNIPLQMRLVFVGEVNYDESNATFRQHRDRLRDPSDGYMDIVHAWRDQYRADDVMLFVDDSDNGTLCGVAYCQRELSGLIGPWEDKAFSVLDARTNSCIALGWAAFTHEIGHNQGCGHNRANAGCCSDPRGCLCALCSILSDTSFGWRFTGASGTRWITVMSYATNDEDCTGNNYRGALEIPFFSTPTITYDGQPIGAESGGPYGCGAKNRETVIFFRCRRDAFRILDAYVDFGWTGDQNGTVCNPFRTVAEAVSAMPTPFPNRLIDFPTMYIAAGSSTERGITISKRMRIEACGGLVRIGAP